MSGISLSAVGSTANLSCDPSRLAYLPHRRSFGGGPNGDFFGSYQQTVTTYCPAGAPSPAV